jgi:hypothetical protein
LVSPGGRRVAILRVPDALKSPVFSCRYRSLLWPSGHSARVNAGRCLRIPIAFTLAPHLQLINYHGCFSPFAGI